MTPTFGRQCTPSYHRLKLLLAPHATPDGHPCFHPLFLDCRHAEDTAMSNVRLFACRNPPSVTIIVSKFSVPSSDHGLGTYRQRYDIQFSVRRRTIDVKATLTSLAPVIVVSHRSTPVL